MLETTLKTFSDSLGRCNASPAFMDRFYEIFLASSPKVAEKFGHTDFERQKAALRTSLYTILLAARDEKAVATQHLQGMAERHSSRNLDIGAELYDLWLDSLLTAVEEHDPQYGPEVKQAWEEVMMVGIRYMLSRY